MFKEIIKKTIADPTRTYELIKTRYAAKFYHDVMTGPEQSIWDGEWDLLIILDACRPDALAECASEFDFLPSEIPTRRSNAAQSLEFMKTNFISQYSDQMAQTEYITGNPYSSFNEVNTESFAQVHEVWQTEWSTELGTIPPDPLTDRAITSGRGDAPTKLIVHFMQPHFPSIPADLSTGIDITQFGESAGDTNVFDDLENGELTHRRAWNAYISNCRLVLDSVKTLISNYDANKAVITADHANSFGENGVYGHPWGCQTAEVRLVPWIEITCHDCMSHKPAEACDQDIDVNVEDQLESLGYR